MASDKHIEITGFLELEIEGFPVLLEAKEGNQLFLTFYSFKSLRAFYRLVKQRGWGLGLIPPHLQSWMDHFHVSYLLVSSPIGTMGPGIKPSWWAKYMGLHTLNLNARQLLRAAARQLFKKG